MGVVPGAMPSNVYVFLVDLVLVSQRMSKLPVKGEEEEVG